MKLSVRVIARIGIVLLFALWPPAAAQQQEKIHRIGYLAGASGRSPFFDAFRQGMRDLGYVDGQSVAIE